MKGGSATIKTGLWINSDSHPFMKAIFKIEKFETR
jgi:hypothetical protein